MTVETDQAKGRPPGTGPPVPTQKPPPPVMQKPPPPISQKPSLYGSTAPQQQQHQQHSTASASATAQQSQPQALPSQRLANGGAGAGAGAGAAQRPAVPAQAAQRTSMPPQTRPAVPTQPPQGQTHTPRPLSSALPQTQRPPVPSQKPSTVPHPPQPPQTPHPAHATGRPQAQAAPCNGEKPALRVIDLDALSEARLGDDGKDRGRLLDTTWMLKQYHYRLYHFNIMCVGETGIGKSTLMDTLFNTHFDSTQASHDLPGVKLKSHTYELKESNVRLKLTFVDTVGFGDQIDKTDSSKPIVDYINEQFEIYLQEELKIKRALHSYHDTRVHVCLYFIAPTGHSLKSLDLVTMKALDSKVNIVPVIAKADTITKNELHKFKLKIMSELVSNGVQIYQFPTDDDTVADLNSTMNGHLPFAVVGSMDEVKVGNKMVKARQYPWGTVQVENESHCDFVKLREMLIRTNMSDLQETTHYKHYELYRRCKLQEMGFSDDESMSLQQTYEQKRNMHMAELQKKEEEMRQMFVVRVKEKESELKEDEKDLHAKFDVLKKQHSDEKNHIETARRILEEEMNQFNKKKTASAAMLQSQQQTSTMSKKKK